MRFDCFSSCPLPFFLVVKLMLSRDCSRMYYICGNSYINALNRNFSIRLVFREVLHFDSNAKMKVCTGIYFCYRYRVSARQSTSAVTYAQLRTCKTCKAM